MSRLFPSGGQSISPLQFLCIPFPGALASTLVGVRVVLGPDLSQF